MENNNSEINQNNDNELQFLKDFFLTSLSKWYWYVISVGVAIVLYLLYLLSTPPTFSRQAAVMITEDKNDMGISTSSQFADIALGGGNANVKNELIAFQSHDLMTEVVKRLGLDVTYRTPARLYKKVMYGASRPFTVQLFDLTEMQSASLKLVQLDEHRLLLSELAMYVDGDQIKYDDEIVIKLGETTNTPLGRIKIDRTEYFAADSVCEKPVFITKSPVYMATEMCQERLQVSLQAKDASVINLQYNDEDIYRAEDVINTLIDVYNESRIIEKNRKATSTSEFITDRLAVIERELSSVDKDISAFKSENLIPDLQGVSAMYMDQVKKTNEQLVNLNMQLAMAHYIKEYMEQADNSALLPVNTGLESSSIEKQISEYNEAILKRNGLLAKSSAQNPLVIDIDQNIRSMRSAINTSIGNLVVSLNTQIENFEKEERKNVNKIAANPMQANYLLSVERQQKIKEALYLFLLQKREENELSQTFTPYNTRIITTPTGSMDPVAPRKMLLLLVALVLGAIVPAVVIYLKLLLNTTISSKKDIEWMTIPYIGEVPLINYKSNKASIRDLDDKRKVVVEAGSHSMINEAFRIIRTNLEFTMKRDSGNVVMFTSSFPNSGKTFINKNLATSFAIKGKRIIVLDLDMRKGVLSTTCNLTKPGISDYLAGRTDNLKEIIKHGVLHENVDIIPVGTIPPNPVELLSEEKMKALFETLKQEYDYIFIDCPPAGILADTDIINQYTDYTIYIIRIGNMDKQHLPEVERYYRENKFNNMTMILNGTGAAFGHYGGYGKYGSYGHYGYYGGGENSSLSASYRLFPLKKKKKKKFR